jgi:RNA methyltransferase, TrmH family
MISKNTVKLIKSLSIKKYREKEGLFLIEGDKMVTEVLRSGYKIRKIIGTPEFLSTLNTNANNFTELIEATPVEIKNASFLKNPQNSMALCQIPENNTLPAQFSGDLTLYLDGVQDPGNLGTIIRLSDWFGIENIFCSPDTADGYNPKVVQASMGSLFRTNLWYVSIETLLKNYEIEKMQVFGAFLEGNIIYTETLPEKALLVIGNEGNGIRKEVEPFISRKIMIPGFAKESGKAESLNVAVATGIICAEFKRQNHYRSYSK